MGWATTRKNGLMLRVCGFVVATITLVPSSTKNQTGKRDWIDGPPEVQQSIESSAMRGTLVLKSGVSISAVRTSPSLLPSALALGRCWMAPD
tara:strand:+ start:1062 stop:1337 length:276 start_codon:yes stop_codon:yes gene_type:complete